MRERVPMETVKCDALVKSVDLGSFTAAARHLGYTPSGITRMIDSLEAEMGFALVNRNRTGITCTREGEALLPLLREAARCGQALVQQAAEVRDVVTGEIVVGTYFSVAAHWIPRIIASFKKDCPHVRVTLMEAGNSDLASWVMEGRVDCAFCSRGSFQGDWIPLKEDELVAWIPSDWPEAKMKSFPVRKFDGMPFVLQLPGTDTDIETLLNDAGVKPDLRFSTDDGFASWSMVSAGLGASINNRLMSTDWKGNVTVLPLRPRQSEPLGIILNDAKKASPATRRFVECAREVVAKL